jgi:glutamate-1-semialdehyde 2,1-aminomutase
MHCGQRMRLWMRMAIVAVRFPVPASSGIPKSMREFIITLPFNDFEGFERVMRSYGEQIAAVITEPCQGNCAAINPQDGFLQLIRKKTEEYGCVFILDEVKTGFRIANGGAQEYYASNRTS